MVNVQQLPNISKVFSFLLRTRPCSSRSSSSHGRYYCMLFKIKTAAYRAERPALEVAVAHGSGRQRAAGARPTSIRSATRAAGVSWKAAEAEATVDGRAATAQHRAAAATAACQLEAAIDTAAAALLTAATTAPGATDSAAAAAHGPPTRAVHTEKGSAVKAVAADLSQLWLVGENSVQRTQNGIRSLLIDVSVEEHLKQRLYKQQVHKESQQQNMQAKHQQQAKQKQQTHNQWHVSELHGIVRGPSVLLRSFFSGLGRQEGSRNNAAVQGTRTSEQHCFGESSSSRSSSSSGSGSTACSSRSPESVRRDAASKARSSASSKSSIDSSRSCILKLNRESRSSTGGCGMMEGINHRGCLPPPRRTEEEEVRSELSTAAELPPPNIPPVGGCVAAAATTGESCCCHCGRHDCHAEHEGGATCAQGEDFSEAAAAAPCQAAAGAAACPPPAAGAAAADALGDSSVAGSQWPSLLVVAGPSGVGKGTLAKRILQCWPDAVRFSVSHTTRAPRPGEQEGRDYYFCTAEEFGALKKIGGFLESASYSGFSYGTSVAAVKLILSQGCICLLEIDLEGVRQVQASPLAQQARFVFIQPPSLSELERRLRGRKTESEDHVRARLATAEHELAIAEKLHFDARIVNDDLEEAWDRLRHAIILWFGPRLQRKQRAITEPQQPLPQQRP